MPEPGQRPSRTPMQGRSPRLTTRPTRSFFAVGAEPLAAELLGCVLVRRLHSSIQLRGRIVETEAYVGLRDRASHAYAGRRTPRNQSMYARPGTAYVYFTYGMHHCFNVVCAAEGDPQAVLIRALEPLGDLSEMRRLRGLRNDASDRLIASGPARLCQALAIDRALDGIDLIESRQLWIEPAAEPCRKPLCTPRIGIAYAGSWSKRLLRFVDPTNNHASRARNATIRPRTR